MKRIPQLIIDTDMSADDLMAILYLLSHKECELLAITVAGTGICHTRQGAQNALRLLSLAGKEAQGIPVASGDEEPLDGFHSFPEAWRGRLMVSMGRNFPTAQHNRSLCPR